MIRSWFDLTSCQKYSWLVCLSEERRNSLWSIAVICVSFSFFFLLVGNYYAASVLYDELVKPPCDEETSNKSTVTASSSNCTQSQACTYENQQNLHEDKNNSKECGGFGQSRGNTAWVNSVQLSCMLLVSPLAGVLVDRFGCRRVGSLGGLLVTIAIFLSSLAPSLAAFILLYSVAGGLGIGLIFTPSVVIVSRYFRKRYSVANGFIVSGTGFGAMTLGPFSHHVIAALGWRGYMRVYGSLIFILALLTLLYKQVEDLTPNISNDSAQSEEKWQEKEVLAEEEADSSPTEFDKANGNQVDFSSQDEPTIKKKLVDWTIWKRAGFVLYVWTSELVALGFSVPMIHVIRFARDINIASSDAALLVTYQGIGSLAGRLSLGLFAVNKRLKPGLLYLLCIIMTGIPMLIAAKIKTYAELAVYMMLYGYFMGGQVTLQAVVICEVVGPEKLAQALGWNMGLQAPAVLIGGPIAGFLHDVSGSYSWSFYYGGIAILIAAAIMAFMPCAQRYDARRNVSQQRTGSLAGDVRSRQVVLDNGGLIDEGEALLEESTQL